MDRFLRYLPVLGTVAVLGGLLGLLLYHKAPVDWPSGIALLAIGAFGFIVAATLRYAVGAIPGEFAHVGADVDQRLRGRLAPLVIGIGTVGILVVAIGALIVIAWGRTTPLDPGVYLGIFSTVIPVFATWVGSVIAFYFTNESFRQAAEASGAIKGDASDSEPITSPTRMIPLEKITSVTLGLPAKEGEAPISTDLALVSMPAVFALFSQTASRVIIFDKEKRPQAIVRKTLARSADAFKTFGDYSKEDQNGADAVNFRTLPETATVGDARALVRIYKTADIFVTKTGAATDPIKGWVPDDKLL